MVEICAAVMARQPSALLDTPGAVRCLVMFLECPIGTVRVQLFELLGQICNAAHGGVHAVLDGLRNYSLVAGYAPLGYISPLTCL